MPDIIKFFVREEMEFVIFNKSHSIGVGPIAASSCSIFMATAAWSGIFDSFSLHSHLFL